MASHSLSQFVALSLLVSIAATSCSRRTDVAPIATLEQIMETAIEPVSDRVFEADVWENGVQVGGPKTDDDWKLVQANAMMLAETCNLLLMPGRAKDDVGWPIRTQAMKEPRSGGEAAEARTPTPSSTPGPAFIRRASAVISSTFRR